MTDAAREGALRIRDARDAGLTQAGCPILAIDIKTAMLHGDRGLAQNLTKRALAAHPSPLPGA
jgi:hypothetical protein